MTFAPISKEKYIRLHLKHNPKTQRDDLDAQLTKALDDYKNGVKCDCGSDIWVIGSSQAGNACFTCITGESMPSDDYELIEALPKGR